mgnify:CR=1 FL=1
MKNALTLIVTSALLFSACKKDSSLMDKKGETANASSELTEKMVFEDGNNPDEVLGSSNGTNERTSKSSHVYIESNDASQNVILVFQQQRDGRLTLESQTASGGKGFGGGLASEGALALDRRNNLLFAVNAGSNSVSSFKIKNDGSLELLSTESTKGEKPVSVTAHDHYVYVVNSGSSDITGFIVDGKGKLSPIVGSHQTLSSTGADPAQISFTPDGDALFISEKGDNKITAFRVNAYGVAYNKVVNQSVGNTPFGFDFVRDQFMVVSNADGGNAGTSSCTSYRNLDNLHINSVNGKVNNGQTAVCWVGTTSFGRFAFAANTGSNTISAFFVDQSGKLFLIPWVNEKAGEKPADIIVSSDNEFVYNINGGSHTLGEYKRGSLGKLQNIGYINSLPDFAAGLVSF